MHIMYVRVHDMSAIHEIHVIYDPHLGHMRFIMVHDSHLAYPSSHV